MIPIKYDASWKHYNETNGDKEKEFCYAATEGYVPLVKDGKWEMRNSKGDLVISSGAFEEILPVYDGKCWVKKDGKWGILKLENAKIDKDSEKEDSSDTQKVSNKMQISRGIRKRKMDRRRMIKRPFLLRHIKKSMDRCLIRPVTNMVSLWIIFYMILIKMV